MASVSLCHCLNQVTSSSPLAASFLPCKNLWMRGGVKATACSRRTVSMLKVEREKAAEGQESVWDYPRPPRLELVKDVISVKFNGAQICQTLKAYRVLETSHPPVYYIPKEDINMEYVHKASGSSFCEWKGHATYWTVSMNGKQLEKVGWSYEEPTQGFLPIQGHIAFYAKDMDCFVGTEKAEPQPGGFYGGWVTANIKGPFKGGPGSWGW